MKQTTGELESWPRLRRMGGARFVLLIAMLLVLTVSYVVINAVGNTSESIPTSGRGWPADTYPNKERVRAYLDGQTVYLLDPAGPPGAMVDFVVRSDRIESLTSRREVDGFTSVTFVVGTDQGRFAVDGRIEHHMSD
jgi:hypothetical protein